jgi:protoheme IX farnesyltransferase
VSLRDAILFGTSLAVLSIGALGFRFNVLAAALALATLFAYVAVYTPLKRVSTLNTVIGALPGAAPPLIGYAAMSGDVRGWAWALFAILFVWQFPHFMSIAWLYRDDYARAGLRMLPVEDGGERVAGKAAMAYGLVLLPVSLIPAVLGDAGLLFTIGSVALGLVYCAAALRFAWRQDRKGARMLLFVSLAYLPLVLLLVVIDPVTGVAAAHFDR